MWYSLTMIGYLWSFTSLVQQACINFSLLHCLEILYALAAYTSSYCHQHAFWHLIFFFSPILPNLTFFFFCRSFEPKNFCSHCQVGSEDIKGVDFVVFEQPEITILSGHVEGSDLDVLRPHLSVEIRSSNDPSKIQLVIPLPLSSYFEVRDLPKGKHLVQLQSRPPSNTRIFESEIVEVDLEKQPQIHVGPLKYKTGERHHKQVISIFYLYFPYEVAC